MSDADHWFVVRDEAALEHDGVEHYFIDNYTAVDTPNVSFDTRAAAEAEAARRNAR